MPERKEDVAEYELQSLLGRGREKSAVAETATATVCSASFASPGEPTRAHKELVTFVSAIVHLQVSVTGMHCSSCSTAVERALRYIPSSRLYGQYFSCKYSRDFMLQSSSRCPVGFCCSAAKVCPGMDVTAASSNFMRLPHASAWRIQVAYNSSQLRLEDILESIRDAGFEADLLSSKSAEPTGKASVSGSQHAKQASDLYHICSHTYVHGISHVCMPIVSASLNPW